MLNVVPLSLRMGVVSKISVNADILLKTLHYSLIVLDVTPHKDRKGYSPFLVP